MSFVLGMVGPASVVEYREWLGAALRPGVPDGLGGSPVNLLCRELLSRGQRVIIFTLDPKVRDEVILDGDGVRICIGPYGRAPARNFFRVEREYLLRAILRERPDVLHAHWTYEFALAAQASGLPHVITAHDAPISVLRYNFIKYRMARTLMAYAVLTRARNVVAVSPYVADHIRHFMLYRGARQVIPNGMPRDLFDRPRTARPAAAHVTYATVLNGWGGIKNAHVAIEAFSRLRGSRPGDRLVMFGVDYGPGEPAQAWATAHGFADGIDFAGPLPYATLIDRLAHEVDVLVHPSRVEAHPMSVVEAMALGIPVIGGMRSGGVPWTLDGGRAGLLADITSPAALEGAMIRLAADGQARRDLGLRGRAHAERTFGIATVADAYQDVYARLLRVSNSGDAVTRPDLAR